MLLPHGRGSNKRPIFPGSNNQAYQVIATWVNKLRSSKTGNDVIQTSSGRARTGEGDGEAFAVDRDRPAREVSEPGMPPSSGGAKTLSPAGQSDRSARVSAAIRCGRRQAATAGHQVHGRPTHVTIDGAQSDSATVDPARVDEYRSRCISKVQPAGRCRQDAGPLPHNQQVRGCQETSENRPRSAPTRAREPESQSLTSFLLDPVATRSTTPVSVRCVLFRCLGKGAYGNS